MKLKKNTITIGIVAILIILVSGISVYATASYYANQISYKNGKTVEEALNELYASRDNRLYLYWKGNTFDSVTGGWESAVTIDQWSLNNNSTVNKKNATFNSDHIDLSIDSTFQYVAANTKNKIDCTGYNYINIYYTMTSDYNTRVAFASNLNSGIYGCEENGNPGSSINYFDLFSKHYGLKLVSIPISELGSEYIFINTIRGISSDPAANLKIYGVFLSTNIDP